MNESDKNLELIKQGYSLWNDTKADSSQYWMDLIAEDVKWSSLSGGAPGMEFTRSCIGKAGVANYMQELVQEWEMIHYTVDEYIVQNDRFVVLSRCGWKHRKTGKTVESPKADIIRMKDSKITEFFEFFDTAQAFNATQT